MPPCNKILIGNALDRLKSLPDEYVHCIITSPPYYNLREYGNKPSTWPDGWHGCLGREPTVDQYVEHLVSVFDELRRVLRSDGNCWLNIGDTYINKRLQLVPQRIAVALDAAGWTVRTPVIWHKKTALPENLNDRLTRNHENIWHLVKSPTKYYFDLAAVRAPDKGNLRTVWTLPSDYYKGSHSAVFPSSLPIRCIKLSTSEKGCCPICKSPWGRVVEKTSRIQRRPNEPSRFGDVSDGSHKGFSVRHMKPPKITLLGWAPRCTCSEEDPVPCLVLDPFSGSGTTLAQAAGLGRNYIGIDIDPRSEQLAKERIRQPAEQREGQNMFDAFRDLGLFI